jgi:hypothetical protein
MVLVEYLPRLTPWRIFVLFLTPCVALTYLIIWTKEIIRRFYRRADDHLAADGTRARDGAGRSHGTVFSAAPCPLRHTPVAAAQVLHARNVVPASANIDRGADRGSARPATRTEPAPIFVPARGPSVRKQGATARDSSPACSPPEAEAVTDRIAG